MSKKTKKSATTAAPKSVIQKPDPDKAASCIAEASRAFVLVYELGVQLSQATLALREDTVAAALEIAGRQGVQNCDRALRALGSPLGDMESALDELEAGMMSAARR